MTARARRLPRRAYARDPVTLARSLLGTVLARRLPGGRTLRGRIVETEAYGGAGDRASHAFRGRTRRNAVMFGPPGHAYVYFTYGMHWLLNVVCDADDVPAAVLIRGIELLQPTTHPVEARGPRGFTGNLPARLNGPARVTTAFRIAGRLNGEDLVTSRRLWIEEPRRRESGIWRLQRTPRIGVDYAGPAARWKRRFLCPPRTKNEKGESH